MSEAEAVQSEAETADHSEPEGVVSKCSPDEQDEAKAMGWIPPERFKPDEGKRFVDAKEFMERNPLYKKMKRMEESLGKVGEHYEKVLEQQKKTLKREHDAEMVRLREAKAEAISQGDGERVNAIDDQIDAAKEQAKATKETIENPDFKTWHKENEWYLKDKVLTAEANDLFEKLTRSGGFSNAREVYDTISSELKDRFPAKFKNPAREDASAVEGARIGGKQSDTRLTAEEKAVMKDWDERGIFDKAKDPKAARQKYIDQVISLR